MTALEAVPVLGTLANPAQIGFVLNQGSQGKGCVTLAFPRFIAKLFRSCKRIFIQSDLR